MKKQILAVSALALVVISGSAVAAAQDVQFAGVVTDVTCDVKPEVNGTTGNYVQLGTVAASTTGSEVPFVLKADAGTGANSCSSQLTGKTATVGWIGSFDANGLTAKSGAATDAVALIKTVNSTATNQVTMTSTTNQAEFNAANLANGTGLKFTAALKGGAQKGDYLSSAAFLVSYK